MTLAFTVVLDVGPGGNPDSIITTIERALEPEVQGALDYMDQDELPELRVSQVAVGSARSLRMIR